MDNTSVYIHFICFCQHHLCNSIVLFLIDRQKNAKVKCSSAAVLVVYTYIDNKDPKTTGHDMQIISGCFDPLIDSRNGYQI